MGEGPIPDDEHGADLPMNMTASVMLTGLPRDAHQALADVEAIDAGKSERFPSALRNARNLLLIAAHTALQQVHVLFYSITD